MLTHRIYEKAKELALTNGEKYHVACVIWRRNKPVKVCVNSKKTHPKFLRQKTNGAVVSCLHAEMSALRFYQQGDRIEVLRFLKCGSTTMARPCSECQAFLNQYQIKLVRYTNWQGLWEELDLTTRDTQYQPCV